MIMLFSSCIKTEEKIMLRSGIDFSRVDSTVRPQEDFYRHVNGTWLKEFELPKDKSRYATFTVLREKAREDVKKIIEEASKTMFSEEKTCEMQGARQGLVSLNSV